MAQISARNDTSMLKIRQFLGLNENPDGDTTLKNGEMAEMRNFRITQDKHLQIRPGCRQVFDLAGAWESAGGAEYFGVEAPAMRGVWHGNAGGAPHTVAAFGGGLFDVDISSGAASVIGVSADAETGFFGFGGKVYLLNGSEYKSWTGVSGDVFETVEGYVPLIKTATTPAGAGAAVENVNRLNGKRRVDLSASGNRDR